MLSCILDIFRSGSESEITPFERLMEGLTRRCCLCYHYTQNIDCRSARFPLLVGITTWLHGRLHTMICHKYAQHIVQVTPQTFPDWVATPCPTCHEGGYCTESIVPVNTRLRARSSTTFERQSMLLLSWGQDYRFGH